MKRYKDMTKSIIVAFRMIVGALNKQIRPLSVPVLNGLQRCFGFQR